MWKEVQPMRTTEKLIQELQLGQTNYLRPDIFYNKFLFWLPRLNQFIEGRTSMTSYQFTNLFRIMYGSGLRVTEAINLETHDIDLLHRIVKIKKAKTGLNQKTTIIPSDVKHLLEFLENKAPNEKLFPVHRSIVWKVAKQTSRLAGLDLFEEQKHREIEGAWTHLFRKSCAKRMVELGANRELIQRKLRHSFKEAIDTYIQVDLNALLIWEMKVFG